MLDGVKHVELEMYEGFEEDCEIFRITYNDYKAEHIDEFTDEEWTQIYIEANKVFTKYCISKME